MAGKRAATTELNHDNWDIEENPEEAGTFKKAPDDVLEKRVVKRAKRRLQNSEDTTKSAFGTFTGFKTATATAHASPFSFLVGSNTNSNSNDASSKTVANINKPPPINNDNPQSNDNDPNKKDNSEVQAVLTTSANKKSTPDQEEQNIFKKSSDYFAKLKGLNESVAQWIKTHVDANPFCILTPIFRDYERYLKEIEAKHGSGIEKSIQVSEQAQSVHASDKKEAAAADTEKKLESSPFGGTNTKGPFASTVKVFGRFATVGPNSMFRKSDQTVDSSKSIFSNTEQSSDMHKSVFHNTEQKSGTKSIFGKNPFLSKPSSTSDNKSDEQDTKSETKSTTTATTSSFATTNTVTFCFGQSSTTNNTSTGFSFGSAKPFTFGAQAVQPQEPEDSEGIDEEDEEPPKADYKPVTEEGTIYQQRCKVFVKKNGNFSDRGVGILFLKPTPNDKTQLLVRAENPLGNLLLNTLLTESVPTKRMSKNTIMLVCLPRPECRPPPVPVLLRVKTDEEANALFEALNKHKK
ncbi:Nuclear pore complex protein Nup50 [Habropoda laboriosa]|uniref:Nuclear pore complex protein Nup50 n=2 Tax=Habropoda laboriosa TaxID=597456 RepID=A0A0L7R235_9HYME|nr:Nuclear pore complex protein Nup50 [Habropoda laboriosa]